MPSGGSVRSLPALVLLALASQLPLRDARAQVIREIAPHFSDSCSGGEVDDAGAIVVAMSTADPHGTNPERWPQLFRWDPAAGASAQITRAPLSASGSNYPPSVSDDGERVAFLGRGDPLGRNPDGGYELFVVRTDGTGLVQLTETSGPGSFGFHAMSGNGARVVFDSREDYLGTNPARVGQLFVVESDGTGMRQITSHAIDEFGWLWPAISDAGTRIVFASSDGSTTGDLQLFGVLHDGTGRRQITALSGLWPQAPRVSGNGSTIAFQTSSTTLPPPPGGCNGNTQAAVVEWDGTGLHKVTGACLGDAAPGWAQYPDISDDGQVIFYAAQDMGPAQIYRVNKNNTNRTPLTDTSSFPGPAAECWLVRAAGSAARAAFNCGGGEPYGGPNPDLGDELYAMTGTGVGHRQLTSGVSGNSSAPDMTSTGSRVVFISDANLTGAPGYWLPQVYRSALDGSDLARVTSFSEPDRTPKQPSITDGGSLIAFSYDGDPLGTNGPGVGQIFAVGADGTGLRQLTPVQTGTAYPSEAPDIAGNGSVIVFHSRSVFGEALPAGLWRVYRVNPDGSGLMRLSSAVVGASNPPSPRVEATGTWTVYALDGVIHRQRTNGSLDAVISAGGGRTPDLTPGGGLVVFSSTANPVGGNSDRNEELFLWEAATGTTRQLSFTATGSNLLPSFSRDGAWVYFLSDAPHFGESEPDSLVAFRVETATGRVERVAGLEGCSDWTWDVSRPLSVGDDGSLAVYGTFGDCAGTNPELSGEIVLVDRATAARIRVSKGPAPTVITWDVESGPLRYDVIRGDVASLRFSETGGVDLGPVVCVENDSGDASTAGSADVVTPGPGQAFFYLYRGSQGVAAAPGSYGQASSGEERAPSAGGCPD